MKKARFFVIAICKAALLMTVLSSCPAPWSGRGSEGTITVAFGPGGRIPVTLGQMSEMSHEITLTGPYGEMVVYRFTGAGPIAITVTPGTWTIRTRTVGYRGNYGAAFPEQMLRALGFGDEPVEVVAGEDSVARVTVISAVEVATYEQLSVAINLARTDNREKIIVITGNMEIARTLYITDGKNITLTSNTGVTIRRAEGFTDPVFSEDGGTITIGDRITIGNVPVLTKFEFIYGENNTIIITGLAQGVTETDIVIPSEINGVRVTSIWIQAFFNNQLTSVVIPDGVTSIGRDAFFGNQLTSVVIPDGVTYIGIWAFAHNMLTSVVIPDSVTSIGPSAFSSNQLTSVVIPDSVTSIGLSAFSGNQLTSVVIPDGVTSIGEQAFSGNPLTSITIPGGVDIADPPDWDPFVHTMGVHGDSFLDLYESNGRQAGTYTWIDTQVRWVFGDIGDIADITITFAANATGVSGLPGPLQGMSGTTVTIPTEQPARSDWFFAGWNTMPDATGSPYRFWDAIEIGDTDITLYAIWSEFEFNDSGANGTIIITGLVETRTETDIVIPPVINGVPVTEIGWNAFAGGYWVHEEWGSELLTGHQLTSVIIPNGVTNIRGNAFMNNQLTSVIIPDSVTSIESWAFAHNMLENITIPNGVTSIEFGAFQNNRLISVTIPDSVTYIGLQAFMYNQLAEVTIPNSVTYIGNNAFLDNLLMNVIIPDNVTNIGSAAFANNQLINVTIGNSVTYIGNAAFSSNQLTNVIIPNSVIHLSGFSANQLVDIAIPNSVIYIGTDAFWGNQLIGVTIPDSVTYIGNAAFSTNQLTNVTIGNSVTSIGRMAFSTNQLESLIIPDSVTNIEFGAFMDNRLISVSIPANITSIGDSVFRSNNLESITIPDSVTTIREAAFMWNPLTSITIPGGVDIAGFPDWDIHYAHTMGTHGDLFLALYESNGRLAGTYAWVGDRWVFGDGEAAFTISFAGFRDMPQNAAVDGPNVRILAASTPFSVSAPAGYAFDNIRWFFDGQEHTGASFDFTREMHGGRLGTHPVTLEVEIDGWWFSMIVNVTVVP